MKKLRINSLCGLMNQLYSNEQYVKCEKRSGIKNGYLDINSLFWSYVLDPKQVKSLILQAQRELKSDDSPKVRAITDSPEMFYRTYQEAVNGINSICEPQSLFRYMETLEMVCDLHTKLISAPFALTLSQGYLINNFSALDLERNCLLPYCNPYLDYINEVVIPLIIDYRPEILVLAGAPNLASFAIAKLAKKHIPDLFVISSDYESDYYSLRKIDNLLLKNTAFFSVYDCVILDNHDKTINQISTLQNGINSTSLQEIPNLIYSLDSGKSIVKTERAGIMPTQDIRFPSVIDNNYVLNMKAFPLCHCYWNRCSFCGINSKYDHQYNNDWNLDVLINKVKDVVNSGVKYIWFLDEAIPVLVLRDFALRILQEGVDFIWHVRARIEPQFINPSFTDILYRAGLRHILFGFESASERILSLMDKTPYVKEHLQIAENIVRVYTPRISVHFSAIFGFPSETESERKETAMFLSYLSDEYSGFSYNVNTFYLDIGSKIYRRWEEYNITCLSFPCAPRYFLGNQIEWNSTISADLGLAIRAESESLIKRQYGWYPEGSLIEPCVFFAFYEYSRLALKNCDGQFVERENLMHTSTITLSPMLSLSKLDQDTWLLYNLKNHHYVVGGAILKALVDIDKAQKTFEDFFKQYELPYREQAQELVKHLKLMGFFA